MPVLEWKDVLICWLAMAVHGGLCARLDPKLAKDWLWSSARAVLQLSALGYILTFLFEKNSWAWNSLALSAMLVVSTRTVLSRVDKPFRGLGWDCFFALGISLTLGILPVVLLFRNSESFRQAPAFLPLIGILLGNSLTGLSLGVAQWLRELRHRRSEVEFWISLGAAPRTAVAKLRASATKTALTSILNTLAVAGVVSTPGMMTGQLLAGGTPGDAVKYQLMVLFLIAGVAFASTWIALKLSLGRAFDSWGAFSEASLEGK
jgi:putative ABC transport system permease protein